MQRVLSNPIPYALALAWLGAWIHDLHFVPATLGFGASAIPWLLVTIALYYVWRISSASAISMLAILLYALVAFAGAILTVLPLSFLPFEPEQTFGHYLAHTVFALFQIPLIVLAVRYLFRPAASSPAG